ncbi:histidine phosphatase family protein [Dokdonia sp. PRO95]|uniref:SixA phosphatase family protein n=1 Tax=Dokdonia sp. PRO95 TaxID=1239415 RepID=UPI0005514943|nr:histidine phosphatase family protein [Dokdonia sp. PRO95]
MKTLYLVRHAKSSWKFDVIDHERPLNEKGLNDAPAMAAHIAAAMPKPDLMMSSDALRAKTTALFFAQAYGIDDKHLVLDYKMYDFAGADLVEVIRNVSDEVDCLMVFGHNNAMTNVVNTYGSKTIDNVSTAAFTAITFDINSWKDLKQGKTIYYKAPKEL